MLRRCSGQRFYLRIILWLAAALSSTGAKKRGSSSTSLDARSCLAVLQAIDAAAQAAVGGDGPGPPRAVKRLQCAP